MGETIAARFGAEPRAPIDPPTVDELELRAPRVAPPDSLAASLHASIPRSARATPTASRFATCGARCTATSRSRRISSRSPATRTTSSSLLDWCSDGARRRDPLRRRVVGGRRRRVRRRRRLRAARSASTSARSTRSSRSTATSRAARIQAGVYGPALEDAAAAARAHAAPLPAVVRVLDPRRLARDALGRSLRDPAHAHRRLRRVDPGGHAPRALGEPAAARLRRRAVARPHAPRLGGRARRDHRGVDAPAGPADVPRVGNGALLVVRRRESMPRARSRSRVCTPPTAGCSTRSRPD